MGYSEYGAESDKTTEANGIKCTNKLEILFDQISYFTIFPHST